MSTQLVEPALIGIDWGTTSFRAFKIGNDGSVLDRISAKCGIMNLPENDFKSALLDLIGPWIDSKQLPIIASGMITSRNGWIETEYMSTPTGAKELATGLRSVQFSNHLCINFVPGVSSDTHGVPDVMRGEETQIIGEFLSGGSDGVYLLPGTHTKWAEVSSGKVQNFSTFMTGELFNIICKHSILRKLMTEGDFNREGFEKGVLTGISESQNILQSLFSARTLPLFAMLSDYAVADYISGMLIGTEVQSQLTQLKPESSITIIGRGDLAERYEIALGILGIDCFHALEDVAAQGHFSIAVSAGLI